jgi:hypothetical protein
VKKQKPTVPWVDAVAELDFVGELDRFITWFIRTAEAVPDATTAERLRASFFFQKHADAARKTALTKLKTALRPIPFQRLPDDLKWIRGEATPPCFVPHADRAALLDLIGPHVFGHTEEE